MIKNKLLIGFLNLFRDVICLLIPVKSIRKRIRKVDFEVFLLVKKKQILQKYYYQPVHNQKKTIIFLVNFPECWDSLDSVYKEFLSDDNFAPLIVTLPRKKYGNTFVDDKKNYNFFKDLGLNVIQAYDQNSNSYFDLQSIRPYAIFVQTPYDSQRPKIYYNAVLKTYSKLCYVPYGMLIFKDQVENIALNKDFLNNIGYIFSESPFHHQKYINLKLPNTVVYMSGYTKFDDLDKYKNSETSLWKLQKSDKKLRIIWTPRWNNRENNCHFVEYKDFFVDLLQENSDFELIFRPHPLAFETYLADGIITEYELEELKKKYNTYNTSIDKNPKYLPTFYSSDVLVADMTSLIPEYMLTRNPIIYCHKSDCFNDFGKRISAGFYWVKNSQELKAALYAIANNQDNLCKTRYEIIAKEFFLPKNGSAKLIKEYLTNDL